MVYAFDMDNCIVALPDFFKEFFNDLQHSNNEVGILTARPDSKQDETLKYLEKVGIKPDFCISKPDKFEKIPNGIYKAVACNKMGINVLFDDFEGDDPKVQEEFYKYNTSTVPFMLSPIRKKGVKSSNK